ncbi:hypothetical protein M433DRAFT_151383 [Acidomyces richmondensis BFW]|nr:MAG: hypothetical protein FE78DRAFT_85284 [Acidomyces sp. 'richmondensis']KYG48169.1 hypothetical protein M433DRAFT_151383 [Acidomyces richmondensis BFW]
MEGKNTRSKFLAIPPEIREIIYTYILHPDANRHYGADEYTDYDYRDALVLFRLNRQIYFEARKVFRNLNTIVRVETPWPEAQYHVTYEGHVPMLAVGQTAAKFEGFTMSVRIDAPEVAMQDGDEHSFLILLDDLEKFTTMWFYSMLSHPALNPQLRLQLKLQDCFTPKHEEKMIPKALQRKLILPFGVVKNLKSFVITGDPMPYQSIIAELKKRQAEPNKSPEACLREAICFKIDGNNALKAGKYQEALEFYKAAWLAIHIVIKGHTRHIHADAFFARDLREPPFVGKNGQSERLILRVQLVANTCQAFLKLHNYKECEFWGMRSINMLREAMGADEGRDISPEDEAVRGFPAANEMGKIYYRTAVAKKMLDEKDEARKLLRVALVYLPADELVKKELAACALRLG